jgi:hypothetical protein
MRRSLVAASQAHPRAPRMFFVRAVSLLLAAGALACSVGCNSILGNSIHGFDQPSDASDDATTADQGGAARADGGDAASGDATSRIATDATSESKDGGESTQGPANEGGAEGGDANARECTSGSTQCKGLQPQACDMDGNWQDTGAPCQYACNLGNCGGLCSAGTLRCNGLQPQSCDASGLWQDMGSSCATVCNAGTCSGVCVPNSMQCSGLVPQTCSLSGQWQSAAACPSVCNAGTCVACTAASKQCNGLQPQTCDATGLWQNTGAPCPFACDPTTHACTGVCTPNSAQCSGAQPQTCDATGQWQNNGKACTYVCDLTSGACTGVCTPGSKQCNGTAQPQTCDANGRWQNDTTTCTGCTACSSATGTCAPTTGATCSDGNACTQSDTCVMGVCTPGAAVICAMPTQCQNAGSCDPASGTCSYANKADGTACNADNSACTPGDACKAGVCVAGTAVVCPSSDACHLPGMCSAVSGQCSAPLSAPNTTACTAANATSATCDGQGNCVAKVCSGGLVVDQGVCKKASCTGVACGGSDGAGGTCTGADGNCAAGSGLHCSQGGTCVCDSTSCSGCCSGATTCEPFAMQSSTSCGASGANCAQCQITNPCMQTVACSNGSCVQSNPISCNSPGQCQMGGACDSTSGKCVYSNKGAGSSCNADNNACTTPDTCDGNGGCTAGPATTCNKPDQCHNAGTCSTATGVCSSPTPAALGTVCTTVANAASSQCDGAGNCKAVTCAQGYVLVQATGTCQLPNCTNAVCGASDGAGGKCTGSNGSCTGSGQHCNASGQCVCDGTSCAGCCDASQQCHASSLTTCGVGGATCKSCSGCCTTGGQCGTDYYPDTDGDTQGDKTAAGTCSVSAPPNTVANNMDCCDTDPNAYKGSQHCSYLVDACGKWDYNCDTVATPVGCCQCSDPNGPSPYCSDGINVWNYGMQTCTAGLLTNTPLNCQVTTTCVNGAVEACSSNTNSNCATTCTWVDTGACGQDPSTGFPVQYVQFSCTPTPPEGTNTFFPQPCN